MQDQDPSGIEIRTAPGKWVVYTRGGIFGESARALQVLEPGRSPVIYVPREDVAMAFFDRSDEQAANARMGTATYYALDTKSMVLENAAWSFENPLPAAERIRGYMAFDTEKVTVEQQ
ncbi:MAG: DUF427 domain-containing protein [Rhodobacteraceae bacterium]|nr:DUF427 domain-containing protein [Paracoccaceae bacterium]